MKILAIETCTEACSAALLNDDEILSRQAVVPRQHAELILPMVEEIIVEAGFSWSSIDAIAYGRGPGAFTGLRICAGVTQGLALANDLAVIPVSSLATLAQSIMADQDKVISAFDARMGEVYAAFYQKNNIGLASLVSEELVVTPESLKLPDAHQWHGIGTGFLTYESIFKQHMGEQLKSIQAKAYPLAKDMLPLALELFESGAMVDPEQVAPVYLRNKVTQ